MPTISKENYLKTIYSHSNEDGKNASTSVLAEKLEVSNAAISDMAKKLSDQGLLTYARYKGVELTDEGEKIALQVIRRHRLWELFLIKVLRLEWSEVHAEAENLEHSTSSFLIDKIDEFLGYPQYDPHGDPIPQKNGAIPKLPEFIPLAETVTGGKYTVVRVNDRNKDLINYISKIGIKLDVKFTVIDKLSFDNSVIIKINGINHSLSEFVSQNLFVRKAE